jgi:hypothetical protein
MTKRRLLRDGLLLIVVVTASALPGCNSNGAPNRPPLPVRPGGGKYHWLEGTHDGLREDDEDLV